MKIFCDNQKYQPKYTTNNNALHPYVSTILDEGDDEEKDKRKSTRNKQETNGRSAAIERAYVHDVYENCEEPSTQNRIVLNPSITKFLASLEPGSFVCDVGSGDGRYLTAASNNPLIYTIGVDRCFRLTKLARSKGSEVAICDNLDLPFRDESFDAVLSLAVVHHFATTERRVGAIRELARILRIGGRVIITVWALEQKNRRFESQDVLVPWTPRSRHGSGVSDEDEEDDNLPYHPCTEDSTNSTKSIGDGDNSSLSSSSPSDTCYSFVRKAIQKLAGSKKSSWFLDSWGSKEAKHDNSFDYEDAKDLPIELRRIEDFDDLPEPNLSSSLKSNSLGSILNPPPSQIVRSQSSVPSLVGDEIQDQSCSSCQTGSTLSLIAPTNSYNASIESLRRPKLVKQKQSLQEDTEYHFGESVNTTHRIVATAGNKEELDDESKEKNESAERVKAFKDSINTRAMFKEGFSVVTPVVAGTTSDTTRVQLLRKQSSLNEELMAESRIREKERIRKRIQKQTSLNETFLCRSLFTKRLQVIREGFTTKLKTSTGSLERVTKNGFVKIMQNIKIPNPNQFVYTPGKPHSPKQHNPLARNNSNPDGCKVTLAPVHPEEERTRRHSRESGSDSSKDSSLQSDTSIESEDSFASVIYIPKPEQLQQMNAASFDYTLSTTPNKIPSVPTSPLVFPVCPPTPAHSPAPPRCKAPSSGGSMKETTHFTFDTHLQLQKSDDLLLNKMSTASKVLSPPLGGTSMQTPPVMSTVTHPSNVMVVATASTTPTTNTTTTDGRPPKVTKQDIKNLPSIPKFPRKASFPIVRRVSAAPIVPKLKSLELFNPETDDLDSDSDEPSSPDSIDSVISTLKTPTLQHNSSQQGSDQPPGNTDNLPTVEDTSLVTDTLKDTVEYVIRERAPNLNPNHGGCDHITDEEERRKHLTEFAEKLSAQLLKELEEKTEKTRCRRNSESSSRLLLSQHEMDNECEQEPEDDPYLKYINSTESKDFNQLRMELRERRLMLADLSSNSSSSNNSSNNNNINHSNNNHFNSSNTNNNNCYHDLIPEEDDDFNNEINYRPDTQALIQEEDSSDELLHNNLHHKQPSSSSSNSCRHKANSFVNRFTRQRKTQSSMINSNNNNNNNNNSAKNSNCTVKSNNSSDVTMRNVRHSGDSWAHSASTASLDSPSVGGGSATHHRYFHVFREGELDTLINHHVASLHIVSSYYERASWCVVAEKVQVWTI